MTDPVTVAFIAVITGSATALAGRRLGLTGWRLVAAWLAVVALAVILTTEQDRRVGEWWSRHPTTGAVVTAVLLLTLTVLIVERAGARSLASAEERRWRPVGRVAAGAVLDAIAARMASQQEAIWEHSTIASNPEADRAEGLKPMRDAATGFRDDIRHAVLDPAPVLMATPNLYEIYLLALNVVQAAAKYEANLLLWAAGAGTPHDPSSSFSLTDAEMHEMWWDVIVDAWAEFRDAVRVFASSGSRRIRCEHNDDLRLRSVAQRRPGSVHRAPRRPTKMRQPTDADFV